MPILDISDIVTTGLTVSGTTLLSGSSTILTVKGQNNNLLTISDAISGTVFSVATSSGVTQFSVLTAGTRIHTALFDSTNSTGTTGQVLSTTPSGVIWTTVASGGFDVFVTGGTYSSGTATFRNNTGGTFTVTGFSSGGGGGASITAFTYSNNTFSITESSASTFSVLFNTVTGLTSTGSLRVIGEFSGTTGQFSGVGGTILTVKGQNNNLLTISDAISGTVFSVATTGGTTQFSVLTAGTRIHTALFDSTNSTGTTGQVLSTTPSGVIWTTVASGGGGGATITAFTYANNTFSITESSASTFSALFNTVTGLTVNGNLEVTGSTRLRSVSATTGQFSGVGSNILVVKGSTNNIITINDNISNTLFSVATTGGTTQFSVLTAGTRVHTFLYDSSNSTGSTNQVLTSTSTGATWTTQSSQATPEYRQISLVTNLANAGDTGTINQTLVGIGYSGTIVGWYITCYPAATVAVDVWKANGAVPTIANTITAAAKPSITAARLNSSLTPTGWTTAVSAGDYFMLNVDSNNLATYINLQLLISI